MPSNGGDLDVTRELRYTATAKAEQPQAFAFWVDPVKVVRPITREALGARGWVLLVDRHLAEPFAVGEVISDSLSKFKILSIEGTPQPREVNLIVEQIP